MDDALEFESEEMVEDIDEELLLFDELVVEEPEEPPPQDANNIKLNNR